MQPMPRTRSKVLSASVYENKGEGTMILFVLASIVLCVVACGGLYLGFQVVRSLGEQFDELLPQRMVDYSGFIDVAND